MKCRGPTVRLLTSFATVEYFIKTCQVGFAEGVRLCLISIGCRQRLRTRGLA